MNTSLLVILAVAAADAVQIPSNFQKCNRNQSNFKECILNAAQEGIRQLTRSYPEVNLADLNPFQVPEVNIRGGSGRPVGVDQLFKNCRFYGINSIKLDDFDIDFKKQTIKISGIIPEVRKLCDYEMKGQVLLLPVNGKGKSTITLKNLKVDDVFRFDIVNKRKKTFLKFVQSNMKLNPELVNFHFESSADKTLSDNINPVLNENWKEVFGDVKGSYEQVMDTIFMDVLNGFFGKVSVEEAFD